LIRNAGGALNQANSKNQKLDIVVIRVNRSGETCNARPCHNCLSMMKAVGIRKVHYSVSPNELVSENVKDMVSIQASSVTKYLDKIKGNNNFNTPDKYYEKLLTENFPTSIRQYNLDSFIRYNLLNVLPLHKVVIDNTKHLVWILDTLDNPIIKANVFL
jgi:hypothetical protein